MNRETEEAELAQAYAHENLRADTAQKTVGMAWVFAIVPVGLMLLLLSALLGQWVWKAALPLFLVGPYAGQLLARLGVRYHSDLPLDLPGHGRLAGRRKKRLVLAAMALLVGWLAWKLGIEGAAMGALRDFLLAWEL